MHMIPALSKRLLLILLLGLFAGSCGYTPAHDIPAKPAYIQAGVKPGDTIVVRRKNGDEITAVVEEVRATAIATDSRNVPFGDIETISVRSWSTPETFPT